ncbi:gamma-glutamyltransferase [Pseudomaricurvus alcaniphilus]|uniref:gamma-glutamyltransferase n=1 Tax=Pseudomaricurvus alcaniphilus TaxID=1166482 RepID=UPI00140E06E3|nr:gamma-glutamyltransferase [Pseudomaricurvus alcaniphilus]NHN39716.1 gamma-glutamyltransferase [Pseudomaricurvus alcaniphilus]
MARVTRHFVLFLFLFSGWNCAVRAQENEPIFRHNSIQHPVLGRHGMVVSQHWLASEVGARVLSAGGNAVDAAVAVGFALAVVLPRAGNLGGGGFMLIYLADRQQTIALDYREVAPLGATADMFLDANGEVDRHKALFSRASAGVPGTVAGLVHAQRKYGSLPLRLVLKPAYDLAREGFAVSFDLAAVLERSRHLRSNPESLRIFYPNEGQPLRAGQLLRQPELAWSLRQIMRKGEDAFYRGKIAQRIVREMEAHDGLISLEDLASYRVVEREPVSGDYNGYRVVSMPPPSSGGVHLLQMLNVLEHFTLREAGAGSSAAIHTMTEAMKWAYADRSKYLGDPDFVDVPVARLIDKGYAADIARQIGADQVRPSSAILPGQLFKDESLDTTHYSVADASGNVVSNTYTLNFSFGSGITVPGTGILLNNEMDDFSAKAGAANAYGLLGAEANKIVAGKRPLSSMTPTIVFKDGAPVIVTGSPGGSRIITTVLQTLVNVIDHELNIAAAVSAPRFHHQWQPDELFMEEGFSPDTRALLEAKGHQVKLVPTMGGAQSIAIGDGLFRGAADPRKPDARAVPVTLAD